MKTIGMLGGTAWPSTMLYYQLLNEEVNKRLGGNHSAKIILKSIDYHDMWINYGKSHDIMAQLLKIELDELISLHPDCIVVCCNSLHKYYDMIKKDIDHSIPIMHAVDLVAKNLKKQNFKNVLLLASKFTMEDGFFAKKLENFGINVVLPTEHERTEIHRIHSELLQDKITDISKEYFSNLTRNYAHLDAIVLACTEFPMILSKENSDLPLIDPILLQTIAAVDFALNY